MAFDTELERDVIAACLRDRQFVRSALPVLRGHDFSSRDLGWIWSVIADVYGRTGELPTPRTFVLRAEREFSKEAEQDWALEVLLSMRRRKVEAPRQALDEVRRFVRVSAFRRLAGDVLEGLDSGDLEAVEQAAIAGVEQARSADALEAPTDWAGRHRERLEQRSTVDKFLCVRMPLPTITRLTNGGHRAGNVTLVCATSGVGKTSFAVDCGYYGLGTPDTVVVHVTTEETRLELETRYDARLTRIPRDRLAAGDLTDDERRSYLARFAKRSSDLEGRLYSVELLRGSKVSGVRVAVEHAREAHPDAMILVVVDSPDDLDPVVKCESYRLAQKHVYGYLKALAIDPTLRPISVVETCQAKQEFIRKAAIHEGAAGESYAKTQLCSVFLGLIDSPGRATTEADQYTWLEAFLCKNRLGKVKRKHLYLRADLGICDFEERAEADAGDDEV